MSCSHFYYIDDQYVVEDSIDSLFRFIHISDVHGSTITIEEVNKYCEKHRCDFVILTGDVQPSDAIIDAINKSTIEYLIVPGNHDAYHLDGPGQYGFRQSFLNTINSTVIFPSDSINYWYKDVEKSGKKLRIIGLDQFESDSFSNSYLAVMTQQQIDWFIGILEKSRDIDGVMVLIHMGFGNSKKGQRDTTYINDFISEYSHSYPNAYDFYGPEDPYMIPEIMDAFISGTNIDKTYNAHSRIAHRIRTHFADSGRFVGFFGGHLHWDEIEYLSDFPSQLQLLIAYCGNGLGSKWNDLIKEKCNYNFNVVDVDFFSKHIVIKREGAKMTLSGKLRNTISFNL